MDDTAKVFDVTEVRQASPSFVGRWGRYRSSYGTSLEEKTLRPLCLTPCTVDLSRGLHELVFQSTKDPTRTSDADVQVGAETMGVRHALGRDKPVRHGYFIGGMMAVIAGGLTLVGAGGAAMSAAAGDAPSHGAPNGDTKDFVVVGLVLVGLGAALGITGAVLMENNRPEKQPGSTVEWKLR